MPLASTSESSHADRLLVVIGAVCGASIALARAASSARADGTTWLLVLIQATVAAQGGAAVLWVVRAFLRRAVAWVSASHAVRSAYARDDTSTYAVFLLTLATAVGVQLTGAVVLVIIVLFVGAQGWVLRRAMRAQRHASGGETVAVAVDALSCTVGLTVAIHGLVWPRALAPSMGITPESTMVVAVGLLAGLGTGAFAGRRLAGAMRRAPVLLGPLLVIAAVLSWGSLPALHWTGEQVAGSSSIVAAAVIGALLMGLTAPLGTVLALLTAWNAERRAAPGRTAARLGFAVLLGASAACFLTTDVIFAFTGLRGATAMAAGVTGAAALLAFIGIRRLRPAEAS